MMLGGLFAALGRTGAQRWGWYAVGCVAYLTIVYQLLYRGRGTIAGKDRRARALFGSLSAFLLVIWVIYPM